MLSQAIAFMSPDHISAGNKANLILAIIIFIVYVIVFGDVWNIFFLYAWVIIFNVLSKIFQKAIQYCCINGKLFNLQGFCRHVFDVSKLTGFFLVVAITTVTLFGSNIKDYLPISLPFFGVLYLLEFAKYDDCKFLTSCWIESPTAINYAKGLAFGFFFGYLNITLPDHGDDNVGFRKMMEKYESVQHVEFPVKKIFILVTTRLHCPPNLADACPPNLANACQDIYLEACGDLGVIERSIAGVISRKFAHSVYKIHNNDGTLPIYVVAEGATSLHTFYKIIEHSGPYQEHFARHTQDVVVQFYESLKQIIASSIECKDLCEVVYFDNANPKTNAARVLLDKINEIKRDE